MRKLILVIGVLVGILGLFIAYYSQSQPQRAERNVRVMVPKTLELKNFWVLNFQGSVQK